MSLTTSLNLNSQVFARWHPYADRMIDQRNKKKDDQFYIEHEQSRYYTARRKQQVVLARGNNIIRSN